VLLLVPLPLFSVSVVEKKPPDFDDICKIVGKAKPEANTC